MPNLPNRFAAVLDYYLDSEHARTPVAVAEPATKDDAKNSKHANSTKAVQTRQTRYGKSRTKRNTKESKAKAGHNVTKESGE